jgi:hypothetical protein
MTFPGSIQKDRGQPALVRIGVIGADSLVYLQDTALDADTVGILGGYTPIEGDTVAVVGQSAIGTAASSWLVLGRIESFTSGLTGLSLVYSNEARASGTFDFAVAGVNPPGMTFTFDLPAGDYSMLGLMTLDAELQVASSISGIGRFMFDGVAQPGEIIIVPRTALVRYTNSSFWISSFSLATLTTITIDAFVTRVNGADGQLTGMATHSKIGVQIFR